MPTKHPIKSTKTLSTISGLEHPPSPMNIEILKQPGCSSLQYWETRFYLERLVTRRDSAFWATRESRLGWLGDLANPAASQLWAYSCSAGFICHQTSAWHHHILAKGISFRIQDPSLCPSRLLRMWQSAAVTADDHCCLLPQPHAQVAIEILQPKSNSAAPSVGKMVCARQHEAGGNW